MSTSTIVKTSIVVDSSTIGADNEITWVVQEMSDGTFNILDPDNGDSLYCTLENATDLNVWLTDEECVPLEERSECLEEH